MRAAGWARSRPQMVVFAGRSGRGGGARAGGSGRSFLPKGRRPCVSSAPIA